MKLVIFHKISDADAEAWDRLTAMVPFASRRWLAFCERVKERALPCYLILDDGGQYRSAAVLWVYRDPSIPDFPPVVRKALAPVFRRRPLLVCEIPVVAASGLVLPQDPAAAQEALGYLLAGLDDITAENRVSFVIFGHLNQSPAVDLDWQPGFDLVRLFPDTFMSLEGVQDYEVYLEGLPRKQRKNIRRNRKAAIEQGLTVTRLEIPDPEEAFNQASLVAARHGDLLPDEVRRVFALSDQVNSHWLVAKKNGRMAGFDLLFSDKNVWQVYITGSDYSTDYVYFLLSDEDIRLAIDQGADLLQAGSHLYEYKERLGYKRLENGYVRFRGISRLSRMLTFFVRFRRKPPPD